MDRTSIEWPGNQLELIGELAQVGKPLVVVQMGGGQVNDTELKANELVCRIHVTVLLVIYTKTLLSRFTPFSGPATQVNPAAVPSLTFSPVPNSLLAVSP